MKRMARNKVFNQLQQYKYLPCIFRHFFIAWKGCIWILLLCSFFSTSQLSLAEQGSQPTKKLKKIYKNIFCELENSEKTSSKKSKFYQRRQKQEKAKIARKRQKEVEAIVGKINLPVTKKIAQKIFQAPCDETGEKKIKEMITNFHSEIQGEILGLRAKEKYYGKIKSAKLEKEVEMKIYLFSSYDRAFKAMGFSQWSKKKYCLNPSAYLLNFDPKYESSLEEYPWTERAPNSYEDMYYVRQILCLKFGGV